MISLSDNITKLKRKYLHLLCPLNQCNLVPNVVLHCHLVAISSKYKSALRASKKVSEYIILMMDNNPAFFYFFG